MPNWSTAYPFPLNRSASESISRQVVPFDVPAGVAYGPIRLATRDSKKDHLDKLIAAHAVSLGVTVVTNNLKDFARYPGVVADNWLKTP